MKITIHTDQSINPKRLKYVVEFLNEHPINNGQFVFLVNKQETGTNMYYGQRAPSKGFHIPCQGLFFTEDKLETSSFLANAYSFENIMLYSVEQTNKNLQVFWEGNAFGFDWLEAIFFHISRYEEVFCSDDLKDKWGMMWESCQFLVRNEIQKIPVVDCIVYALCKVLQPQIKNLDTKFILSHDVDVLLKYRNPYRFLRSTFRALLDKGLKGLWQSVEIYWAVIRKKRKDPYDSFDFILQEQGHNSRIEEKQIFLMSGGATVFDKHYDIKSSKAQTLIKKAQLHNYKTGLHGSYLSFKDLRLFVNEKKCLEKITERSIVISRQHFLRFDFNKTSGIIQDAGIRLDSSLGYQRIIGFRCGTGYNYHLYNFHLEKKYDFLEQPLVVMDTALWSESEGDLDKAFNLLQTFLASNKNNTRICFNFHNSFFDPILRDASKLQNIYKLLWEFDYT